MSVFAELPEAVGWSVRCPGDGLAGEARLCRGEIQQLREALGLDAKQGAIVGPRDGATRPANNP